MGAQPKNKITRAEQGKRRAGNTPKLIKDASSNKVPLHKKTLFGKISKLFPVVKTTKAVAPAKLAAKSTK